MQFNFCFLYLVAFCQISPQYLHFFIKGLLPLNLGPAEIAVDVNVTVAVAELVVAFNNVCVGDSLVRARTGEVPTLADVGRRLAVSGLVLDEVRGLVLKEVGGLVFDDEGGLVLEAVCGLVVESVSGLVLEEEGGLVLEDGRTFPTLS